MGALDRGGTIGFPSVTFPDFAAEKIFSGTMAKVVVLGNFLGDLGCLASFLQTIVYAHL